MFLDSISSFNPMSFLSSLFSSFEFNSINASGVFTLIQTSLLALLVFLVIGFFMRLFFGRHCLVNRSLTVSMGVLFIYVFTIAVYSINPWDLSKYLSPLPFADFRKDIVIFTPFSDTDFSALSSHILSLIILCFNVHLLNTLLPTGSNILIWFLIRLLTAVIAIFFNLSINLAFSTLLPSGIAFYAPIIVLTLLGIAILIGLFNPLLCIIFTVVNPIIGLLYTFFFSNIIGKQLIRAVLSAVILCFFFTCAEYFGYSVLNIAAVHLPVYLPFCAVLMIIWWIFDIAL